MIRVYVATPTVGTVVDSQVHFMRKIAEQYAGRVELVYPDRCVRRIFHDFARNAMVEDFLDSGCDVLWFLDSDVTPPEHILDLVTESYDKWKVAGGIYPIFMPTPGNDHNSVMWAAYAKATGKGYHPCASIPDEGRDFVDGLATGCIMVKREVFTEILPERPFFKFSYDENTRTMTEGEDFYFIRRCNEKGLKFFTDFSMRCKHQKSVDLMDVNEYAIRVADEAVAKYQAMIKEEIAKRSKRPLAVPELKVKWT